MPRNSMEVSLFRPRSAVPGAIALCLLLAPSVGFAAAEVHRFSLALSGVPTQINAGDFNDNIEVYNRTVVTPPPRGYDPLPKINFSWLFDSELRYFATRNLAITAGVGQLRGKSTKEYLPALVQAINVRAELLTVPVHIGATYYLQAYNQGDFQARAYIGGGFVSVTQGKVLFEQLEFATDSATTLGGSTRFRARGDGPGYYFELGGHMFFASRYSVILGGIYRSAVIRDLRITQDLINRNTVTTGQIPVNAEDTLDLDVGGLGVRMAVAIGF